MVRRHYATPPVVEALAELYFEGSAWDVTAPGSFYERVKGQFPNKEQLEQVAFEVEVGPEGANARMGSGAGRALFRNADETRLVQVAGDVLVLNQLPPYPHFEAWSEALLEMLAVYREVANPTAITRLGMRYINRIGFSSTIVQMEDYFRVYAEVPDELGAMHGDFLIRLQLPTRVTGHEFLLTLGRAPADTDGHAIVLDLYDTTSLGGPTSFDEIQQSLSDAHENIEWVFEHTITDATRAIFGGVSNDFR